MDMQTVKYHSSSRKNIAVVIFLALLVIIGGFLYYKYIYKVFPDDVITKVNLDQVESVPKGKIAESFPKELIIIPNAHIVASSLLEGKSDTGAMLGASFVKFATTMSAVDVLKKYIKYVQDNNYIFLKTESSKDGTSYMAVGRPASNDSFSVLIVDPGGERLREVTIVVTKRK